MEEPYTYISLYNRRKAQRKDNSLYRREVKATGTTSGALKNSTAATHESSTAARRWNRTTSKEIADGLQI